MLYAIFSGSSQNVGDHKAGPFDRVRLATKGFLEGSLGEQASEHIATFDSHTDQWILPDARVGYLVLEVVLDDIERLSKDLKAEMPVRRQDA